MEIMPLLRIIIVMVPALGLAYVVVFAWWYFNTMYQDLIALETRQKLYMINAQLFDAALNQKLSFHDEAYRSARLTIFGLTENVVHLRLIVLLIAHAVGYGFYRQKLRRVREEYACDMSRAIMALSSEGRDVIKNAREAVDAVILVHIIRTSIILLPIFVFLRMALWVTWQENLWVRMLSVSARKARWSLDCIYAFAADRS